MKLFQFEVPRIQFEVQPYRGSKKLRKKLKFKKEKNRSFLKFQMFLLDFENIDHQKSYDYL